MTLSLLGRVVLVVALASSLAGNARAAPLAGAALGAVPVSEDLAAEEENPWVAYLMAPMALPWPCEASLQGWAPWGRSSWVKNLTAFTAMWCGVNVLAAFPFSLVFTLFMFVAAVVLAVVAVYMFITSGLQDGCCPSRRTVNRGSLAFNDLWNVWTWAMCLSYVMCTPWLGFKLIQRGWYAFREPIPVDKLDREGKSSPPRRRAPAEEEDGYATPGGLGRSMTGDAWAPEGARF